MKNIAIAIIALLIAFLLYHLFQKSTPESGTNLPIATEQTDTILSDTASLMSLAPDNAAVFIMEPGDGTTVSSPVTVKFGITNMVVAPAGDNQPNSGHHHLLINVQELPDMSQPLPAIENIIHYGKGQTETTLELPPGEHTLQLLLGNYLHIPHIEPVISKKITITVQ